MAKIVVDLTPILPGGENGGAKLMILALIEYLGKIAPDDNFILLTSPSSHKELAILETRNICRVCVADKKSRIDFSSKFFNFLKMIRPRAEKTLLEKLKPDLIFFPFTAPFFILPGTPVISVVHDLQYLDYSDFFTSNERINRDAAFQKGCKESFHIICVSEFTRQSVLKNSAFPLLPEKVSTIPNHISKATGQIVNTNVHELLKQYNLEHEKFLLYPANFWKHKNHKLLLTAFAMYLKKFPSSTLKLVCTGASSEEQNALIAATKQIGLSQRVLFPGYVSSNTLSALLLACRALIFPSLYEGFGIPLVEAMLAGKPILSSNKCSLPEVGGNVALYFDPRKPNELVSVIQKVEYSLNDFDKKILSGYKHAQQYVGIEKMAKSYYNVFQKVLQNKEPSQNLLYGIFDDSWISEKLSLVYPSSKEERTIEVSLFLPEWHPQKVINVTAISNTHKKKKHYKINKGETLLINYPIEKKAGHLYFLIKGAFQPSQLEMGDDNRMLGCLCRNVSIHQNNEIIKLWEDAIY